MARATSRASEVDRLIADLSSPDAVRRDASVARLRVIGARALPRLSTFIASPPTSASRALAIAALDGITDPLAAEIALGLLSSTDDDAVAAALGVLRGWVAQESGTELLEAITAIAVDRRRSARIRAAAIEALADLPEDLVRPIREQAPPAEDAGPPLDDARAALDWIEAHGAKATLATLHDTITRFRDAETRAETRDGRDAWVRARGAAHRVLADRGSRIALYDARETLARAPSVLPPGFLDAIGRVGDAACLEPLARAWSSGRDAQWRLELAAAAREIVRRGKLGGRNAVVRSVRANWPGFI